MTQSHEHEERNATIELHLQLRDSVREIMANESFDNQRRTVPPGPWSARSRQRELVRFFRQRNRVFGALGQPIIFWLLFGAGWARRVGNRIGSTTPTSFPARW